MAQSGKESARFFFHAWRNFSNVFLYRLIILKDKTILDCVGLSMERRIARILDCAKKHGLVDADIEHAIKMTAAARYRNFDPPAHIAFAGPDSSGNLIEVLAAEQQDGSLIVYHAMRLTKKMAKELDLL